MLLTAAAVVVGASVILFDLIFQGLALSSDGSRSSIDSSFAHGSAGSLLHERTAEPPEGRNYDKSQLQEAHV